jgi:L-fuculose-phosphate aldolase
MLHRAAREALARTARQLAAEGLVIGAAGNLSARATAEHIVVTPTGAALATLAAEHVAVLDRHGQLIDGPFAPTSELALHLALYDDRPDGPGAAGAVVHTHAPMATALACVNTLTEVPVVHYAMAELGGSVRVAPYATYGTPELAEAVLTALEDRTAALMANHGAVTVGATIDHALELMRLLEWACGLYWHARAIGKPRVLDEQALAPVRGAITQGRYATRRPASGRSPDPGAARARRPR